MEHKIVNIINFVRGCEPRDPKLDLVEPVCQEIRLNKKYGFPNTFLLQYDALMDQQFVDLFLREKDEQMELGIWFECVRPLVEACGIPWRGAPAQDWDWHVCPDFLMAYTQEEKKCLIDRFMDEFQKTFGCLPASAGSWLLDSWSAAYMAEHYGIKAFAICREQYGVDGYTLWGGYYNQGYYPSRKNILCPGQTKENTLFTPVFRMLGPDPIYCYDENEFELSEGIIGTTIEPAWKYGYMEKTVDSCLAACFQEECMDFAYITIGQENSFGWDKIGKGLALQMERLHRMEEQRQVKIQKLCDTGMWFRRQFPGNPTVSLVS